MESENLRLTRKALQNSYTRLGGRSVLQDLNFYGEIERGPGTIEFRFSFYQGEAAGKRMVTFFDDVLAIGQAKSRNWLKTPPKAVESYSPPYNSIRMVYCYSIPHVLTDVMAFNNACQSVSISQGRGR
jgi:hypothetical protein